MRSATSIQWAILLKPVYTIEYIFKLLLAEVSTRGILSRVDLLVVEVLDEAVESSSDRSSENRSNPVDPVITGEDVGCDSRAEATGWVQRATGVKDTCRELAGERRQ
jgi:hypothetical protein